MKKIKFLILLILAAIAIACLHLVACSADYNGEHETPDFKHNEVLHIERNRLSFALDMNIDSRKIIEKCNVYFYDDNGEEKKVTEADLKDGTVEYEEFDLKTVGSNKQIKLRYRDTDNFIFYDVNEYKVNFYKDEEQTRLWKSVTPTAELNDALGLAVWVSIEQNNYSVDETVRDEDPDNAIKFSGWYDSSSNPVTGLFSLATPFSGNERIVNLHAHFLSDEEFSRYELSYDGSGRRVFSGYVGEAEETLSIPEGVTYIDIQKVFADTDFKFKKIHIPSTAKMDLPLIYGINTAGLTEITVDSGSLRYASYNGALYSKDYSTLYFMPTDCTQTGLNNAVTEFGSYSCAFWRAQSISLPSTVTALQHYCFAYSALERVDGLQNVKTIMAGVFYKSKVTCYEDDVAQYIILSGEGDNRTFTLSFILDRSVKSYTVAAGTVSIAGDAFRGCENLTEVDLGNSVESIGNSAFSGCVALKSVSLPPSLKYIGTGVFYGCSSLTTVTGLNDVAFMDESGDYSEHTLPDKTFYNCTQLQTITLVEGIKKIGSYAFNGCAALAEPVIPSSVETIGSYAFQACAALKSVSLPSSLTSLGSYAFAYSGLESVDFSACNNLKTLPSYCFAYSQLKEVDMPSSITSIPSYCFYNITTLKRISLGGVTSISTYAFGRCSALTEIDLGKVKTIGTSAFRTCTALKEVTLPDSVTTVGGYAFASCSALEKLNIGKGMSTFGTYTFLADGVNFDSTSPVLYLCAKLREVNVDEANQYFKSVNGVLYGRSVGGKNFGVGGVLYALPSSYPNTEIVLSDEARVTIPYAAHGLKTVQSITLNEGLTNIGKATFYNSASITTLIIPATVTNIGASILLNCNNVSSIKVAEGNKTYSYANGQMSKGSTLVFTINSIVSDNVEIEDGITEIASGVFMNNTAIKTVVFPDSVTKIETKAFNGCTNLTSITIGKGLETLADDAFAALPSLATIIVDSENSNFKSVNNVLYSKDGKKLWLAAAKNGMTSMDDLEEGVTEIGAWAFAYHATLEEVILPGGITAIGDYSFYECRQLWRFFANEGLETIGERAFSFATSVNPDNSAETRFCDMLVEVMLYGNIKKIGENAFYGQYGIVDAYFHVSSADEVTAITSGSKNINYLTRGCPNGSTGTCYNPVVQYLYIAVAPTIEIDGYSWFYLKDGMPEIWQNPNIKEV